MGCDIHAYVEYVAFKTHDDRDYWTCLITNAGGRDYQMFSLLADCGRGGHRPVFANRGFPEGEVSHSVKGDYYLLVDDASKECEGYCSTENADAWVQRYSSTEMFEGNGQYRYVSGPDWHSASWLTCDELAQVISHYMTDVDGVYDVEWDAILAAMRALEDRGHKTRLVFWFDN